PEAYRDERPHVLGAAERPGVRLVQAHQPDVVDDVADGDGGDPDGKAREDDTRVIHGVTVMQNAKFKMQTLCARDTGVKVVPTFTPMLPTHRVCILHFEF